MHRPTCADCPFAAPGKQAVGGEWWVDDFEWHGPTVMCIGQNPGRTEDMEGHPFVGPSGIMLKNALRQAGIRRAYMTNAAMCASDSVDLSTARICRQHLDEELEQVKPDWIFTLGNVPLQRLRSGKGTITAMMGKEIRHEPLGAWLLPMLHPAFILRSPGAESAWLLDMLRFGKLIAGDLKPPPSTPPVDVRLIDSGKALVGLTRLLETEPVIAYDFETNSLDWWATDFVPYTIAFSFTGGEASVVPLAHPDVPASWRKVIWQWLQAVAFQVRLKGAPTRLVHNGLFDDLVWYRLTGKLPHPTWDTMIGLHLLNELQKKTLKWAGRAYLMWPDWDIDASKYHPLQELYPYNGYDAAALPLLWETERELLSEDQWLRQYAETVEMPKLRALERMLARGIYVDRSTTVALLEAAVAEQQAADRSVPVANPASTPQVAHYLYQELGLPVLLNGKTHPSTNESTLNRLALSHPEVRAILACRRPRKKITTYYRPILKHLERSYDGRYHPSMSATSVVSGRLGGFFHTTPRDTSVRQIFTAPPGRTLVSVDLSQIEARLCAWMAVGRPAAWEAVARSSMLWAFHEEQDIYRLFAALALRKREVTKEDRQIFGKVPILAMLYQISWQGLQEYAWIHGQIEWTASQARHLHALFQRTFPEFPIWHRFEEMKLRARGVARSPVGRQRHVPGAVTGNKDEIRSGVNFAPQSLASDITQASMILLDAAGARIVGNIHDALLVEAPSDQAEEQARVVANVMTRAALDYLAPLGLYLPPGLIKVEANLGTWGLGEKLDV